jgi:hypothetical protein
VAHLYPQALGSRFVASYYSQGYGGGIRPRLHTGCQSQSQSYVTTDGQSASLSWWEAPIWGLGPNFYYCQTVADLFMWGALSDERTGLPFTIAAGLASAVILGSEYRGTRDHIYCKKSQCQSHIATDGQSFSKSSYRAPSGAHDPLWREDRFVVYAPSPRQRSLSRSESLRTRYHILLSQMRLTVRVRVRVSLRLAVYRQSVRLGAKSPETQGQNCLNWTSAFIVLCKILSDERMGYVIYNCCWPWPAHSFSGPSPAGLMITF